MAWQTRSVARCELWRWVLGVDRMLERRTLQQGIDAWHEVGRFAVSIRAVGGIRDGERRMGFR